MSEMFSIDGFPRPLTRRQMEIVTGVVPMEKEKREAYIAVFKKEPKPTSIRMVSSTTNTCPHRSEAPIGEVQCPTCGGNVRLKVYACSLHEKCTLVKKADGHACCEVCLDRPDSVPGKFLNIPEPPDLNLSPNSNKAVVTVVVGKEAEELHKTTGLYMETYARRLGADFVVLRWPGLLEWPMSAKFGIWAALQYYQRIIYADADVLFRPQAVDLFYITTPDRMGVYDERPFHIVQPQHDCETAYDRLRAKMGFPSSRPTIYFNAGVMVIPQSHRKILLPPRKLWVEDTGTGRHCAEQNLLNARLWESGLPFQLLDRRANWQSWPDKGLSDAPPDAILHWSGGADRQNRVEKISKLAADYPL